MSTIPLVVSTALYALEYCARLQVNQVRLFALYGRNRAILNNL